MRRRRGKGQSTALPTVLLIAFALAVLAGIAILITAGREPLPPVSTFSYEERPAARRDYGPMPGFGPRRGQTETAAGPEATFVAAPAETATPGDTAPGAAYLITGVVTDARTREPVAGVHLLASRVPTPAEEAEFNARDREASELGDADAIAATFDQRRQIWADASGQSGPDGRFRVPITAPGEYQITVRPRAHLRQTVEKRYVGESNPEWKVDIALETGAIVSGRVTDSQDGRGIEGITVRATFEEEHWTQAAETAEDGTYTIGGLSPGAYSVIADIERTPYRVTRVLPFRKTQITAPDQQVANIDFKLDKGGVVWGYVTTPDNEPVSSTVMLVTSESVLTQALTAMVRRAPPLTGHSSREDGYYELVGVPLNEEWRLYATADKNAPQLANPFIITPRNKEVRVDITMFDGSDVFGQVVDSRGRAVPDAQIVCIPSYRQLMSPMESAQAMREERSDEGGFFTLAELPAGNYQVMAHKQGFKYAIQGTPLYANGYHDVKNFRVVLENIASGRYKVFGTVEDAAGQAVEGARVVLSGLGTESLQGVGRETETGAGGDFEFDGVEIGTYTLSADKAGFSRKTLNKVLLDEPNRIVLEAAAVVRGRVLVRNTQQAPENGYRVGAMRLGGPEDEESGRNLFSMLSEAESDQPGQEFADPQGRYELTLAAGAWQLEARAEPHAPARREINLLPGDVLDDIDLILSEEGSRIEGFVRTTDGQSPQGATVFLVEAGSASQALTLFAQDGGGQSIQVAEDGAFQFERLAEGTYFVVARHPAYPQAMSPAIYLEAEDSATGVEIVMGPGGSLEGYVFDNGRPASGWVVTVIAHGQPYTASSDENGAYEIRNIPEGKFQAFASNPSLGLNLDAIAGQGHPVTIWSGSVTYQNFGEFEGITVVVNVFRSGGNPLIPSGLENIGARVVLNPGATPPLIGEGIDAGAIPGEHYTMAGQSVTIPDVSIGPWRVDYYELERTGTFRWRGMQDFEINGEEPEVLVELYAN